jgi:hypothetical protein
MVGIVQTERQQLTRMRSSKKPPNGYGYGAGTLILQSRTVPLQHQLGYE